MWEAMLKSENHNEAESGADGPAAVTSLIELQKAFEKVQPIVVRNWRVYFKITVLLLLILCGYFAHHRRALFEDSSAKVHSKTARQHGWCSFVAAGDAGCNEGSFLSMCTQR